MSSSLCVIGAIIAGCVVSAYYQEEFRPQFHFSPESQWTNDPNGLVYLNGEYHLFYQFHPYSTVWGPMHWAHAVSADLVHWEHLDIALYPDDLGYIFSGSAVIDANNASGFGINSMVAVFTHSNAQNGAQYQSVAYSTDRGRSWTKYPGNPVIPNPGIADFRDPKVIWDEDRAQWVLALAAYDKAMFYTSTDLLQWSKTGEFGIPGDNRLWECPDLFPLTVEGSSVKKWVLLVSMGHGGPNSDTATSYFVGDFDGSTFTADYTRQKWLDFGADNYATVTWSNAPNGRILALGWMNSWQYGNAAPTERWRGAMTTPRELRLVDLGSEDFAIKALPVDTLRVLEKNPIYLPTGVFSQGSTTVLLNNSAEIAFSRWEFLFETPANGTSFEINFINDFGSTLGIGLTEAGFYFVDRTRAGISGFGGSGFAALNVGPACRLNPGDDLDLLLYLDAASVELFAEDGLAVMTETIFPENGAYNRVEMSVISGAGDLILKTATGYPLNSIWN